ncbi:MAG: hypothetical protein ACRDJP_09540 [Actinomycetota bacterium]
MRLRGHDQGFVTAPPEAVYAALADPSTYRRWWPGASATGADGVIRLPLGRGTVDARPEGHREGVGLYLTVPRGSIEWYLEPFEEGSIVNAFSDLDLPGGPRRAARRLHAARSSIHAALVHLKRWMEPSS